ncbi:MAG: Cys-tRNA(Pro) deacylase [Clostridia bacterium]|nr:Cys-tRNA(Pro) deacylase [Clostridia bacterium]
MANKKEEKTNVMRLLDAAKIEYSFHSYDESIVDGQSVAKAVGEDENRVFKTLVTVGSDGEHYVFMIPVNCSLNLRKAAKAAGVKSVEMIKQKDLLPLTGYIHGGCSPIGMKKKFPTFIEESATLYDKVFYSAGRVGRQVSTTLDDLIKAADVIVADLV